MDGTDDIAIKIDGNDPTDDEKALIALQYSQQELTIKVGEIGAKTITPELEHRKSGYVERKRRPYQGNVVRIA